MNSFRILKLHFAPLLLAYLFIFTVIKLFIEISLDMASRCLLIILSDALQDKQIQQMDLNDVKKTETSSTDEWISDLGALLIASSLMGVNAFK